MLDDIRVAIYLSLCTPECRLSYDVEVAHGGEGGMGAHPWHRVVTAELLRAPIMMVRMAVTRITSRRLFSVTRDTSSVEKLLRQKTRRK